MHLNLHHVHAADDLQSVTADDAADGMDGELASVQAAAPAGAPKPDAAALPLNAVVRVVDQIGDGFWLGSGVLIAPDEVLTASHVVYQAGVGTATSIDIAPGYDSGAAPFGHVTGTLAHYVAIDNSDDTISYQDTGSDYAIIHLAAPMTGPGTMAMMADFAGGPVHVTGYPGSAQGARVDSSQSVTLNPNYAILNGTPIGSGSSGGPVWTYAADGTPTVVGLVSSHIGSVANFTQITAPTLNQIKAWVQQDDAPAVAPSVAIYDASTAAAVADTLSQSYAGPARDVHEQFIDLTSHNLNIAAKAPGYFIRTGSGNDAVSVLSGTNVVDGGAGSNFLTGGSGIDTFFVDDRGAASDTWSTIANFHAGDVATVWGISSSTAVLGWADNAGAAGHTGLTLHARIVGGPTASLTLAGFKQSDLSNGRLSAQFGLDASSGSSYLTVRDNLA